MTPSTVFLGCEVSGFIGPCRDPPDSEGRRIIFGLFGFPVGLEVKSQDFKEPGIWTLG